MTKIEKSDSIIPTAKTINKIDPSAECTIGKIYQSMINVMQKITAVEKSDTNKAQGFKFRSIDSMLNYLHPIMAAEGIFIIPEILDQKREEKNTKSGTIMNYTILKVRYRFCAVDGSFVDVTVPGEACDSSDKGSNKAMSAALKYALIQCFMVPTEEDKDSDAQSHELLPREEPPMPETENAGSQEPQDEMTEAQSNCIAAISLKLWDKKSAWANAQKLMIDLVGKGKLNDLTKSEASIVIGKLKKAEADAKVAGSDKA